jgi:guanylate kinase
MGSWVSSLLHTRPARKIVLVGPVGAGKTYNAQRLAAERGYRIAVSVTTRPPREGEVDGVDYTFITTGEFEALDSSGLLFESVVHGDHKYGLTRSEWAAADVFVCNARGVDGICENGARTTVAIVYLNIPIDTRLHRVTMERAWTVGEFMARDDVDTREFTHFTDYDSLVTDPDHDILRIVDAMAH